MKYLWALISSSHLWGEHWTYPVLVVCSNRRESSDAHRQRSNKCEKKENPMYLVSASAALVLASAASAAVFVETEDNDTIANANFVTTFVPNGGAVAIDGNIDEGDVDWFEINIADDATLVISTLGSIAGGDAQLMVVDGTGTDVIGFDDDSGVGFLPALQLVDLDAGTYFFGISAFSDIVFGDDPVVNDVLFDGLEADGSLTGEVFDYKLSIAVNLVPSPGAVALAGIAGFGALRRRR